MKNRILVVDDEPGLRRAVERVLGKRYELALAATPSEAIEMCTEFRPEVAILDVRMPEMDGFELMARLKDLEPHLDVILMTGSLNETDSKMIRAIRERAFYFVQKPFDREVLLTLVERALELHRLAADNRRYLSRLESELAQALSFQQSLLPAVPYVRSGVHFEACYQPSDELGGDFYDHAQVGEEQVGFIIADVSGHGAAAAMLTGIIKSAFQSLRNRGAAPLAVVERIASGLRSFDASRFVTLMCGRIDVASRTLEYVNAGHPAALLYHDGDRETLTHLRRTGPMAYAGIDAATWVEKSVQLAPGASILMYTDGVIEARSETDFFGMENLERTVRKHADESPANLLEAIVAEVDEFSHGRPRDDDLTMLHVRCP